MFRWKRFLALPNAVANCRSVCVKTTKANTNDVHLPPPCMDGGFSSPYCNMPPTRMFYVCIGKYIHAAHNTLHYTPPPPARTRAHTVNVTTLPSGLVYGRRPGPRTTRVNALRHRRHRLHVRQAEPGGHRPVRG